jgi:hypothetical protein
MGVSGQRHAPAALIPPGKGLPVPTVTVLTSKRTKFVFITKISWLMLFKEITCVYSDNHMKAVNSLREQTLGWLFQQMARTHWDLITRGWRKSLPVAVQVLHSSSSGTKQVWLEPIQEYFKTAYSNFVDCVYFTCSSYTQRSLTVLLNSTLNGIL